MLQNSLIQELTSGEVAFWLSELENSTWQVARGIEERIEVQKTDEGCNFLLLEQELEFLATSMYALLGIKQEEMEIKHSPPDVGDGI